MLTLLIAVSCRSLVLGAVAGLAAARVRSAAARHAIWTLATAGMLAMAAAIATLPAVPVRVMKPAERRIAPALPVTPIAMPVTKVSAPVARREFPWESLAAAIYAMGLAAFAGRLAYGYRMTRRLGRGGRRVTRFEGDAVYESEQVAAPLTVGWLRPKIYLPAGWEAWPAEKLDAVLVHERNHVRRGDWAIAVLAGINRCVFWFHPLAWGLERRLQELAEEACDDASLAHVASRELYAQVLVEIAAAVRAAEGRVIWSGVAMAKGAGVGMRVERILDGGRTVQPAMTRGRWMVLACCAVPVVYLAAVMRPARALAQDPPVLTMAQQAPAQAPVAAGPEDAAVSDVRRELARKAAELTRFKAENIGRLPDQFAANVERLNVMQMMLGQNNEALSQLQRERLMLETQLQNLNSRLRFEASEGTDGAVSAEDRLRELELQLAAKREALTPQHPDIRRLEEQIASAERVLEAVAARGDSQRKKALTELEGSVSVVKTEMQNINLQMAEKAKQAAEIDVQIAAYRRRVESTQSVEGRYAELAREYELTHQRLMEAQAQHEGRVQLAITFGADGKAQKIEVTRGQGAEQDERAMEWARTLRFVPPARDGKVEPAVVTVEVPWR